MLLRVQVILAGLLVTAASSLVLLWLSLLTMSYGGESGLLPWIAAAAILYGLGFNVAAAAIGVPGIIWANLLQPRVPPNWARAAKAIARIGIGSLVLGFLVAVSALAREQMRPRNPHDGCVSYRSEAASAAMDASGTKPEIDCPLRK